MDAVFYVDDFGDDLGVCVADAVMPRTFRS